MSIESEHDARFPTPAGRLSRHGMRCRASQTTSPVTRDDDGIWHIRDFHAARAVLQARDLHQAGFGAKAVRAAMTALRIKVSVLYQDGETHLHQRRLAARSFTPATVASCYRPVMERVAQRVTQRLARQKQADVSALSLEMAIDVAAHIVGLTNSHLPGRLVRRLERFFTIEIVPFGWRPKQLVTFVRMIPPVLALLLLDVLPAIRARRRARQPDVISSLIDQGCSRLDILSECITYASAGMVTTREFITMALWHMMECPELAGRYLDAPEAERLDILREILRLEPVISHVQRRTTTDVTLSSSDGDVLIPKDSLLAIHVHDINVDERIVGEAPLDVCPARQLRAERVTAEVISFGDGRHRCPGEFVAIQETDVLLRHLLRLPGLRIVRPPDVGWNELVGSYELRGLLVAVE